MASLSGASAAKELESLDRLERADCPDGGAEAWIVVVGSWCAFLCSFGWISCIGVFQDYYQRHQLKNYSPSTVAWIPSTEIFVMFFCSLPFGKLFDSYGPRYILLIGSFLHIFGLMMTSLSSKYYQFFLAQSICSSVGASALLYAAMNSVTTWFSKKRSTAIGVTMSGTSVGGVIFPIMVAKLVPKIGFPWTIRVVAFVILGICVIVNVTVKSRLSPRPKPWSAKSFGFPFREATFVTFVLANFVFAFGTFIPYNFIILQAQAAGMSSNLSSYLLPILNAASLFGRVIPGIIADRLGRFNTTIVMSGLSGILVLAVWIPTVGNPAIILFTWFYGFFSGAYVSLGASVVAQISPIDEIGVRNGIVYGFVSLAVLTGNPIGGALLTKDHGDFQYLEVFCGVTMCCATFLFIISRATQAGLKPKVI